MKLFKADMHIHTCLSPCGDWGMSPKKIIEKSLEKKLDIIGICDHNSAENIEAVIKAGDGKGIRVVPGMEICSKEEVHILSVFETTKQAVSMQEYIYDNLPGKNSPDMFGYQIVADENDEVAGENQRLLIGATTLKLSEIVDKIHLLNGLCIASHVDRPVFGIISQLGFIPPDLPLDGVEISWRIEPSEAIKQMPDIKRFPFIVSSDAHFPDDIGKAVTKFFMAEPTIEEMRLALTGKYGRHVEV
ncbi:MAG: PHP-associated domain-containing protein [Desulfobacterales bacterium]|nr:PHP-associated domain-containing protein [Desulfobacterales bacterium]